MQHSDKVLKARARLLLRSAFFGALMVSTPMFRVPGLGTAATDMRTIAYDPQFFDSISLDEVVGVLAHEILHIALKHGLRRQNRDPITWNIACDHAVNLILADCGFLLPRGGLLDRTYTGMSAEQIYDLLLKNAAPHKKQDGSSRSGGGVPDTRADGVPGLGSDLLEPGSVQSDGTIDDTPAIARPDATRKLDHDLSNRIAQALAMGRMAGSLPGSLLRAMDDLLHPPVPWQDLLRPLVHTLVTENETWSRRNRRFQSAYLPSRHSTRVGKIVVIGDTSGSITNDNLKSIGGAIIDIAEEIQPESIHVLWADARIAGEQVFDAGDVIRLEPVGGGGTDMRVPLARVAELDACAAVLITDGYTPWPSEPPDYPLIVVCTTKATVPIGQVVRI